MNKTTKILGLALSIIGFSAITANAHPNKITKTRAGYSASKAVQQSSFYAKVRLTKGATTQTRPLRQKRIITGSRKGPGVKKHSR